jgi:hypothetical protein
LNLHKVFSSPFADILCNFPPKLRLGCFPNLWKKALSRLRMCFVVFI